MAISILPFTLNIRKNHNILLFILIKTSVPYGLSDLHLLDREERSCLLLRLIVYTCSFDNIFLRIIRKLYNGIASFV